MNVQQAHQQLLSKLITIYDEREANNITHWIIEEISGFSTTQAIINKHIELTGLQQQQLQTYTEQLLQHKPVQYVLNKAWFYGYPLYVNDAVLIPRPETEELVAWVISSYQENRNSSVNIMDIGTGSGCIAIALKKKLPLSTITAVDINTKSLAVAEKNALALQADIQFLQTDFLQKENWEKLPVPTILVSNPPYIPVQEKDALQNNVKEYEPYQALFVPNNNPLIFYEAIANFALQSMQPNALVFVEVHENYGKEIYNLWKELGLNVELKKDLQGKDRMIKAKLYV